MSLAICSEIALGLIVQQDNWNPLANFFKHILPILGPSKDELWHVEYSWEIEGHDQHQLRNNKNSDKQPVETMSHIEQFEGYGLS